MCLSTTLLQLMPIRAVRVYSVRQDIDVERGSIAMNVAVCLTNGKRSPYWRESQPTEKHRMKDQCSTGGLAMVIKRSIYVREREVERRSSGRKPTLDSPRCTKVPITDRSSLVSRKSRPNSCQLSADRLRSSIDDQGTCREASMT